MSSSIENILLVVLVIGSLFFIGGILGNEYKGYKSSKDTISSEVYKQLGIDINKYKTVYGSNDDFKNIRKMVISNKDDVIYKIKGAFICLRNNSDGECKIVYKDNNGEYRYDNIKIEGSRVYIESLEDSEDVKCSVEKG